MAYKITEDCLACGACVPECPTNAIVESGSTYVINADDCTDCGVCVDSCPADAIKA
ncbi:MAG: 4Fe-4S binding protein [Chitinivibrionia bacterium]|jgi:NAD-dependent dihydropyrimidine dehydrogenase PreA subunit|nr:4Fe-4S binding protein [Chitinivibrionia bacterium]